MSFSKSFPRTTEKSSYPIWEEISLNDDEEKQIEELAHNENIKIMKQCFRDAKKIISEENLKDYQSDVVELAVALFRKNASHSVYWKESKCKEKFDEKFKDS
tara:strand:+ start:1996 stop:2301 length:306 start_codon:yes stop_codon:yes gene_type:complete